jgi:hypothetical protein
VTPAAAALAELAATAEPTNEELLAGTPLAPTPAKKLAWPCPRCGADNSIELDMCGECGAPFLSGATSHTNTNVPFFGDIKKMTQGQRLFMGIGAALILMVVFFVIAEIIDHL